MNPWRYVQLKGKWKMARVESNQFQRVVKVRKMTLRERIKRWLK